MSCPPVETEVAERQDACDSAFGGTTALKLASPLGVSPVVVVAVYSG